MPEQLSAKPRDVAILLFDDVEVLDFAGPFEVFSVAGQPSGPDLFRVRTVSRDGKAVRARGGLRVQPDAGFASPAPREILVIPGGSGTRALLADEQTLAWIRSTAAGCDWVLSVCTGSLVLAALGLLRGLEVTTHHTVFDRLLAIEPTAKISSRRYVAHPGMILAAGVSAGIDASFALLRELHGHEVAAQTARYMEYEWKENGDIPI